MPENLPARIDRAALERIIQRAAELQTGEREIGDSLTPDEVLNLGKDVGIPARYLQQAILEEQTRSPVAQARGALDRLIGSSEVGAQRVVRGDGQAVQQRLAEWMEENELLAVQRQLPGRVTWEPLRGFHAALRRSAAALGGGKQPFMLARASQVAVTVSPLEPGYCHVGLTASLRQARGSVLGGVLGLGAAGVAVTAILALMSPFWWVALAPLPLFLGLATGVARRYPPIAERVQLGLERALDHLERGEIKPTHALAPRAAGVISLIADEVRKALRA